MLEKEIILTPLRDHRLPPLKSPHRTRLEFVCFLFVLNQLEGGARWQQLKGQRRSLRGFRVMLTLAEMELSSLERGGTTTISTYEHSEFSQEGIGPTDEQRNHHCHHHPNALSYMPRHAVWWRGAATTALIVVIYLLNKSHVGCCLSSSPWIFISFRSSFSEWWVSPNRVYICAVLCKLQSPRIRLLLLITHHSFISTVTTM